MGVSYTHSFMPFFLIGDWVRLINELEIVDEYGTYIDPRDGVTVLGNMDKFARDVRLGRV
jgi:hypothetical protein